MTVSDPWAMTGLGGRVAARIAAGVGPNRRYVYDRCDPRPIRGPLYPDAVYERAAQLLGLYGVAFYGHRGTRQDRRRLRDAWAEARAIASLRGTRPASFDDSQPPKRGHSLVPMRDAIDAAKRAGSHFFDPDTLRFFGSRVSEYGYRGADGALYFVTSERDRGPYPAWDGRRLYTVRRMDAADPSDISDVGGFGAYAYWGAAHAAAKRAANRDGAA